MQTCWQRLAGRSVVHAQMYAERQLHSITTTCVGWGCWFRAELGDEWGAGKPVSFIGDLTNSLSVRDVWLLSHACYGFHGSRLRLSVRVHWSGAER